jgi:hypothetical protein
MTVAALTALIFNSPVCRWVAGTGITSLVAPHPVSLTASPTVGAVKLRRSGRTLQIG